MKKKAKQIAKSGDDGRHEMAAAIERATGRNKYSEN